MKYWRLGFVSGIIHRAIMNMWQRQPQENEKCQHKATHGSSMICKKTLTPRCTLQQNLYHRRAVVQLERQLTNVMVLYFFSVLYMVACLFSLQVAVHFTFFLNFKLQNIFVKKLAVICKRFNYHIKKIWVSKYIFHLN